MILTNKDKRASIEGLTIQLKGSTLQEYKSFKIAYDEYLQSIFLDWFNNYLTYEKFAEHYEISITRAEELIKEARTIHERLAISSYFCSIHSSKNKYKDIITNKASKELGMNKKFLDEKIVFIMG
jgi:hypothetical protein